MWKNWKIQKAIKKGDYLYALVPDHPNATKNGYVLYHRIIVENKLKRLLTKNEVVHHKDRNKHNNKINNLEVMTRKEHEQLHSKESIENRPIINCANCGKPIKRRKSAWPESKKTKNAFCSYRCNGIYNGYKPKL